MSNTSSLPSLNSENQNQLMRNLNEILANNASSTASTASVGPVGVNVENFGVSVEREFPDASAHIKNVKTQIATVNRYIETIRPALKKAIDMTKELGVLNVGDKSFRGRNAPSVYVTMNKNTNDYVVHGNFTAEGRPFRVKNANSFNSVLSQMKTKKRQAKTALAALSGVQTQFKQAEAKLATLTKDLQNSTAKLRSNMHNLTAKRLKQTRKTKTSPTYAATTSQNTRMANTLLTAPTQKKTFWQRMTGRGLVSTRRNTRR
jgi:archaellum component FlaC